MALGLDVWTQADFLQAMFSKIVESFYKENFASLRKNGICAKSYQL